MTATKGLGTYGDGVGVVTPLDHKMAHLGLIVKTAANTIRPGLFWDGSATVVSGKANMSYDVRAFAAVTSRGSTAGAVLLTNDAVYNVDENTDGNALTAPGSNSRYDVVFIWPREFSIDGTDSDPVIGVLSGTAAAAPTVPALTDFPGAIELARILVPAGVTATNSGTTITQTAPFTATGGGVVVVRNSTERDASSWTAPQAIYLLDQKVTQFTTDGTSWSGQVPPTFHLQDGGSSGANSGTLTGSAWTKRPLNTTVSNQIDGASVSSGVITLPAGTYRVRGEFEAYFCLGHKVRLRQTSGTAADVLYGTTGFANNTNPGSSGPSFLRGKFTISASQTFEVQHWCNTTRANNGMGTAASISGIPEVFANLLIEKIG